VAIQFLQTAVPEAMTIVQIMIKCLLKFRHHGFDAAAIGPRLGTNDLTADCTQISFLKKPNILLCWMQMP
jgi:hypothetical protein